jgi:antitoxin component YwqK of YwqJK toxin-antitoxin module
MKRLILIAFVLFGVTKLSYSCCIGDDRTLTEKLFQGNPGTIFTCKVLTFTLPKHYPVIYESSGSIDAVATAEIIEVFFGSVDTSIVTLQAAGLMTVGKTYLIHSNKGGRLFSCGGNCDKWTKELSEVPSSKKELEIVRSFANLIKNKKSGYFTFSNSENVLLSEGNFKKGKPTKLWKHNYENGKLKAEYDFGSGRISQFSSKGIISTRITRNKNSEFYERFSEVVGGELVSAYKDVKTDRGSTITFIEYFSNGRTKLLTTVENIKNKAGGLTSLGRTGDYIEFYDNGNPSLKGQYDRGQKIGIWQWFRDDGSLKSEVDYKNR